MTGGTVLSRALRYGIILAVAVAIVAGVVGWLVDGTPGLVAGLVGGLVTALFMSLTAGSFVVASRVAKLPEGIAVYYGIILGTFILKFVVFLVLVLSLRGATWLNPTVFGFTIIGAVLGTLVVDVLALQLGRVPYTDASLPGETEARPEKSPGNS
jgi:hypothetical protein